MNEPVYILGGGRTDFKRNLKKEGKTIRDLITESGRKAIDDAKIDPAEIEAAAVGNFNAGQFTKQLHLGAFIPRDRPEACTAFRRCIRRPPALPARSRSCSARNGSWVDFTTRSSSSARNSRRRCRRWMARDVLGAAADYHIEKPEYGDFMFPKLFGRIAQIYIEKYGASPDDLASVAYKNYAHARLNPMAQMRDANLTYSDASQVSDKNPSVAPPLTRFGLLADHRRQRRADAGFGQVPRSDWPRQIEASSAARVWELRPIISRSRKRTHRRFRPRAKRPTRPSAWRT